MINQPHKNRSISATIGDDHILKIKSYIQGSVYSFCNNCPDNWFAARNLFGGKNSYWSGTPLVDLYNWHKSKGSHDPIRMAGKDVGWLLLDVLDSDKRTFDLRKGRTNEYKWTGEEEII